MNHNKKPRVERWWQSAVVSIGSFFFLWFFFQAAKGLPVFYQILPFVKAGSCQEAKARYIGFRESATASWRKLSPNSTFGEREDHSKLEARRDAAQLDCARRCIAERPHDIACTLAWESSRAEGEACEAQVTAAGIKRSDPTSGCYPPEEER